jgi:hypothetical protein
MAYTELTLSGPFFHFTDVEAFKIIASTGKIRFSRADQTNDPFEFNVVREAIIRCLKCMIEKDEGHHLFWIRILHSYTNVSDPKKYYISCFSLREDSIPMWRLYASEGSGIAFGLRPSSISSLDCRITKVEYLSEHHSAHDEALNYIEKALRENGVSGSDLDNISFVTRLIEATVNTKRAEWDYEREIRFSFSYNEELYESLKDIIDRTIVKKLAKYKPTKPSLSNNRQYLFQEFGKVSSSGVDKSGAIDCVVLGPYCAWTQEEAVAFMRDQGYKNFSVRRSKVEWL